MQHLREHDPTAKVISYDNTPLAFAALNRSMVYFLFVALIYFVMCLALYSTT
ncbi:hypothetical protein LUD20_13870 [Photorhabdus noenieputensis]|nr:hypothetical protein [Photorhabdus noenieputensis]MCK3669790.1 hypothetical protein [Photorhabdus noenieputensis]